MSMLVLLLVARGNDFVQRLVLVIGNGRVASAILKLCLLVRLTANLCLVDILYGI